MNYTVINDNLSYVTTSYKDIYTTVYLIKTDKGYMLFDTASFDEDIDNTLIPYLNEAGVYKENLKYLSLIFSFRWFPNFPKRLFDIRLNFALFICQTLFCLSSCLSLENLRSL